MNPYLQCSSPNFWLSCITIRPEALSRVTPEKIRLVLEEKNIESRPIWKPMHLQPVFKDCDFVTVGENVSEDIFERGLCLPSDIKMTEEEQGMVIELVKKLFKD
jgi:dTDP-4-amino-4,6-dideoxygalactose transaminase